MCGRRLKNLRKLHFVTFTYFLKVKNNKNKSLKQQQLAQKCVGGICRFGDLPSKCVTAKIVLLAHDLRFEGDKLKMLISLKQITKKMRGATFKD